MTIVPEVADHAHQAAVTFLLWIKLLQVRKVSRTHIFLPEKLLDASESLTQLYFTLFATTCRSEGGLTN